MKKAYLKFILYMYSNASLYSYCSIFCLMSLLSKDETRRISSA